MVFESVVAELLNRFLGDFVNNLDASQLNIGIWGGDVTLTNLEVKETALDEFDLPVKLKFGYLSELVLKIPWKNLYQEPVIASVEGLNLIIVPNKGVVYNEEKAKKNGQEAKQKALMRLEENRKRKRAPKSPEADSFTEKLVAQVIKNLQIKVQNIHIRYEDKYTNRHRPFVAGFTLESLQFSTTDSNWQETIHKEAVQIVYKLVSLNNLAIYWNSKSKLMSDMTDNDAILKALQESVVVGDRKPESYKYILEPITLQTKLALNQKPETDGTNWKTPKIDLKVAIDALALCIGKYQYQDLLLFLEAQERFNTATRYLKYRPNLNEFTGHYVEWWHFAYQSILEENVRRRRNNWNWERIRKHRKLVKDYKEAWLKKQTEKSLSRHDAETIETAEESLDVFNLNIARQQADLEIDRRELTRLEDKPQGWVNWAKSWWGTDEKTKESKRSSDIVAKFEEAMTEEEKAKLFEAIDYQENTPPTDYPKHFVENVIALNLHTLMIVVEDALSLKLSSLVTIVHQRPSANAINIENVVKSVTMFGCGQPMLSMMDDSKDWLRVMVDTNPLDPAHAGYDQYVKLAIAPTLLKYHAPAVNTAIEALRPPESVRLNQLTAAAMARYEDVKARSATGLAHAVETKTKLVLDISIAPATIVVSETGVFDENKMNLITDLGLLTIVTTDDDTGSTSSHSDETEEEKRRRLLKRAYDKFEIRMTNIQLILANNFKSAMEARSTPQSRLHVLRPTGMDVAFHKSSIDDLQLPKMKIFGALPDLIITISDERLLQLVKLLLSIPSPAAEKEVDIGAEQYVEFEKRKLRDRAKMRAIMEADEISEEEKLVEKKEKKEVVEEKEKPAELEVQQIQLDMRLTLNQVGVVIEGKEAVYVSLQIRRLGCSLEMRTFDMVAHASLGGITLEQPQYKSLTPGRNTLYIIDNELDESQNLLQVKFVQANKESPFFATVYKSTEQAIDITFRTLAITLHQEALMNLKQYGEQLQAKIAELQEAKPKAAVEAAEKLQVAGKALARRLSQASILSAESHASREKLRISEARRQRLLAEASEDRVIKTRIDAIFKTLSLYIGTNRCLDTSLSITNVHAAVMMRVRKMEVLAGINAITMEDCTNETIHKRLLAVCGDSEMFTLDFIQYNRTKAEKEAATIADMDMSVKCRFAQLRFIFLNLWMSRMLSWMEPFQAEAARAAAQAQAAAAEKAVEAAQNVKQLMEVSPPRISLDVEMAAPTIILPQKSTSLDAIVVDLGNLTVNNTFATVKKEPKAIIEEMEISLKDVYFGIGLLEEKGFNIVSRIEILEPITFTLSVFRNLCFVWYKANPEIVVDAHIPKIHLSMSQEDYATVMKTLSGNLAEKFEDFSELPVQSTAIKAKKIDSDESEREVAGRDEKPTKKLADSHEAVAPAKASRRFVFSFKLEDIVAALYSGSSNLEGSHGAVARSRALGFATMQLNRLKVSGCLNEDGSMDFAASLAAFTMDDERRGATKITRLLDKKPDKTGNYQEEFVGVRFQQSARNDKIISFSSSALFLCLCPEFLGALASFFTVPQSPEELEAKKGAAVKVSETQAEQKKSSEEGPGELAPAGTIAMNCLMREVEVILVEDSNRPESSQALILSFSCEVGAEHKEKLQLMNGGIRNLQIVSCYYDKSKRSQKPYQVLNRVNFDFNGMIDDETKDQNFTVTIGFMHLKISPAIIRLLSAVGASFSAANQPKEVESSGGKSVMKKFPNYWKKRKIERRRHWWFVAPSQDDEDVEIALECIDDLDHQEHAEVRMENLVITLESGSAHKTAPMILVESAMHAVAEKWSGLLSVDADMQLQVSYYNEAYCVWEPVIEPVEVQNGVYKPWIIKSELRTHSEDEQATDGGPPLPKQVIDVRASEMLNVTVTKSFLALLNRLSSVFELAAKRISPAEGSGFPGESPCLILNNTGLAIKAVNSETLKISDDDSAKEAAANTYVDLSVASNAVEKVGLSESQSTQRADLRLIFNELGTEREINIRRAEARTITLPRKGDDGKQWKMVAETKIDNFRRLVYLRSTVQFVNHMDVAFEVHTMRDTRLDFCGIASTNAEPLDIPIPLLYTATGELYIKPAKDGYEMSNESVCWNSFEDKARHIVRCDISDDMKQGFYAALIVEEIPVRSERGREVGDSCFIVHIYSPITLHNFLPFPLHVTDPIETMLGGGDSVALNVIPGQKIEVSMTYRDDVYSGVAVFPVEKKDLTVVTMNSEERGLEINVGVHWNTQHRRLDAEVYAPYWFINNTGRSIKFAESRPGSGVLSKSPSCVPCHQKGSVQLEDIVTQEKPNEVALLPFCPKDFFGKKKARLSLTGTTWSDEFPLDAVGSAGRIACKDFSGNEHSISISITLCQSGLTKVVTFLPFYLIHNQSKFLLEFREFQGKEWTKVEPESCIGFWPFEQKEKRKFAAVRYGGTEEESILFPFTESFEGFCQIDSEYLGFYVTCTLGDSSSVIRLEKFQPGMSPAFIMNATTRPIEFGQKGARTRQTLDPLESVQFTWTDATRNRELEWSCGEAKGSDELLTNKIDSHQPSSSNPNCFYTVSFLNGRQRVYLFTDDLAVATRANEAYEIERVSQSIEVSLQGIGLSLVDNLKSEEIAYMGIASSSVIWEQLVKSRYKLLTLKQMESIEAAYQKYLTSPTDRFITVEKLEIDFSRMKLKKRKGETSIRRQFQTGFWLLFRQSQHQTQMHMKINHLQIDNQLNACVFPRVLSVVPPPKSVVQDNAPKPFTEFSFTLGYSEHSNIPQIKYLHILVQEFCVQIDQGLLNAILTLVTNEAETAPYTVETFAKDYALTSSDLASVAGITTSSQQKAYYSDLHISPLLIHLSFSQGGSSGGKDNKEHQGGKGAKKETTAIPIQSEFINVFLKSVGVTLTEIQDVVFKLAFFERKGVFYTQDQLRADVTSHYTSQVIKQLYVLVLGLDIIGNPFGLVRDLSAGVEDLFYQPFQGAIQGPEEFAEGVALGVKGLFGATVGGGAGAVSRITGTLGKGIAALTLDEEYQRKRQQALNKRPQTIGEGVARGAKGLGQGIYEGVTGVVSKPLAGARTGGATGFAKGLGLGLVGAVTRPVSGVVDFASSSLDALKTAAGGMEETKPLRPPRVIFADNIVRPYCQKLALGAKVFRDADHGALAETDYFVCYAPINEKSVFIVTDKRVALIKRSELVGVWSTDWQIPYTEMKRPEFSDKCIKLELRKKQKGFLGVGASNGKVVQLYDNETAEEVSKQLTGAYEQETEG